MKLFDLILLANLIGHFICQETCNENVAYIFGEGSESAAPIYTNLASAFRVTRSSMIEVNFSYTRTNSQLGIEKMIYNRGDNESMITFAASEITLTSEERRGYPQLLMIPTVAEPLAIIFKLPNISQLILSPKVIADIYLGKITMWNDPLLQTINPTLSMPSQTILPVARMDKGSGETYEFTSALSDVSEEWNRSYGIFVDPQFAEHDCCNSRKWPSKVISFFGNTANGMTGIVSSIPYTIGYAAMSNAFRSNVTYAFLYNKAGQIVAPSTYSVQAAMNSFYQKNLLSDNLKTFTFSLNNGAFRDEYPFAALSYMIVNSTTNDHVSCCAMRELIGFLSYLFSGKDDYIIEQYKLVPLTKEFRDYIEKYMLPMVTCQGKSVYTEYIASLTSRQSFDVWKSTLIIVTSVFAFCFCLVITGFIFYQKQIKQINESQWLIKYNEFSKLEQQSGNFGGSLASDSNHFSNIVSHNVFLSHEHADIDKIACKWNRNGNKVILMKLHLKSPKWIKSTKLTIVKFIKDFQHNNLVFFHGLSQISTSFFTVSQFCPKDTLHHCLSDSEYEITTEMKCCIASNVIEALKYLHKKQVTHGFLNSLSCYVDANWTVKVGDWQKLIIYISQNDQYPKNMMTEPFVDFENDNVLIQLLYVDPFLAAYSHSQLLYQCDVYSLGVLLIEIFTQNLPFLDEIKAGITSYPNIIIEKFQRNNFVPPMKEEDVPLKLQTVVIECLSLTDSRPNLVQLQRQISKICKNRSNIGMVDIVMSSMEKCIADRTSELKSMTKKLEGILHEVLPPQIASKLLMGETVLPEFFEMCTVLFCDIVGFTEISARSTPMQVMDLLNETFTVFDKVLEKFDVYKIDTIGDAYMVASGVPNRNGVHHCKQIADFALVLSCEASNFVLKHIPSEKLKIRTGINSGPVTAGIIGRKMPQYCIFGDTVNTSSRMESTCLPEKIQVSETTRELLMQNFPHYFMSVRGKIDVKGKGKLTTYWLLSKNEMNEVSNVTREANNYVNELPKIQ